MLPDMSAARYAKWHGTHRFQGQSVSLLFGALYPFVLSHKLQLMCYPLMFSYIYLFPPSSLENGQRACPHSSYVSQILYNPEAALQTATQQILQNYLRGQGI